MSKPKYVKLPTFGSLAAVEKYIHDHKLEGARPIGVQPPLCRENNSLAIVMPDHRVLDCHGRAHYAKTNGLKIYFERIEEEEVVAT